MIFQMSVFCLVNTTNDVQIYGWIFSREHRNVHCSVQIWTPVLQLCMCARQLSEAFGRKYKLFWRPVLWVTFNGIIELHQQHRNNLFMLFSLWRSFMNFSVNTKIIKSIIIFVDWARVQCSLSNFSIYIFFFLDQCRFVHVYDSMRQNVQTESL